MAKFDITKNGPDRYTVRNVPIFKTHDNRGYACDVGWMQEAIQNHQRYAQENDWLPTVVVGHTRKGGPEKEAVGFLDNFKFDQKKGVLYADITDVPEDIKSKLQRNAYPNRSVEVLPKSKRILALALLGGTAPHFALPQMRYSSENSEWYRSAPMGNENQNQNQSGDGFTEDQRAELYQMVGEAAQSAIANTLTPEPEVYEITDEDAMQLLETGEMPELYEDEDGRAFCYDEDENAVYYVTSKVAQIVKGAGRGAGRGATAVGRGAQRGAAAVGRGASAARKKGLKTRRSVERTGRRVGRGVRGGAVAANRAAREFGSGARGRSGRATRSAATRAGQWTGRHRAPLAAGAAGGAGFAAGRRGREYEADVEPEEYAFDDDGIVYANGEPVGKVVPLASGELQPAPEDLPTGGQGTSNVQPQIDPAAVGSGTPEPTGQEMDPGPRMAGEVEELPMDEEDEAMEASALGEDPERYELNRRVEMLERSNALLQASNKAEHLRQYLMQQKRSGAPVGDLDSTLDYLMSQDDEQIEQFKQMLEKQPKVSLGANHEAAQTYDTDETQIRADYEQHKNEYKALGVDEEALKYAEFVRLGPGSQA